MIFSSKFTPRGHQGLKEEYIMASTDTSHSKGGSKSGAAKSASSAKTGASSGKQGGSHEQHVKAGEQSHKNSK
ncbi:hypothetical protein AOG23_25315 [Rhizobium acidisoli]|nr:hypothetical protein AOG23_25315 [Rhizobium acidisoli]